MTYAVALGLNAQSDIKNILAYIEAENPHKAVSFVEDLLERMVDRLSSMPNAGSPLGRYRFIMFGRYVIVYRVDEEANLVRVLLVSEGHRDWREIVSGWPRNVT